MAAKMVVNFRRSLSFSNHHPSHSSSKPQHVRSVSLPCRSHPLISALRDHITKLKSSWISKNDTETRTTAWLCDGMTRLKTVHEYFDDVLRRPQTHESVSRHHHDDILEKLLEDFLKFVDVFGIFQTLLLALKQEHYAAQVAVRRKDYTSTASYVKALKRLGREMGKLGSAVGCVGKNSKAVTVGDAELAEVVIGVVEVTVIVSASLFNGISSALGPKKPAWMGLRLRKKKVRTEEEEGIFEFRQIRRENFGGLLKKKAGSDEEVKMVLKRRMLELEGCIGKIEVSSEGVFRSLINSRVSLLNVLTN